MNNINKLLVLISVFLVLAFAPQSLPNVSAYPYNSNFYHDHTGNPAIGITPGYNILQENSCSISLNSFADFTDTGSFSVTTTFYAPNETIIGSGTRDLSGNQNCINLGTSSTTDKSTGGIYEGKTEVSHTASSGTNYLRSRLSCDIPGDWINFSSYWGIDNSYGFDANTYYKKHEGAYLSIGYMANQLNETNFGLCNSLNVTKATADTVSAPPSENTIAFYFPFNSSSGLFGYDLDASGSISGGTSFINAEKWYYYKLSDSSTPTELCSGDTCSGYVTLDENTEYVLMFFTQVLSQVGTQSIATPNANFSINIYTPDWDCSDWSECVNGTETRTCIDPLGKLPDRIEYQFCYSGPIESIYLGFENITIESVWFNYFDFTYLCLACGSNIKTVQYPDAWTIQNINLQIINQNNKTGRQYDFLKMTSEQSYEGDRSLKMWNLPPQANIPEPQTFIGFTDFTDTGYISPTNYTDNNGVSDPQEAFVDEGASAKFDPLENINYTGYDLESEIPVTATSVKNVTIRIDARATTDINFSCVKIGIDDFWSDCEVLNLTTSMTTYIIEFTAWVLDQVEAGNFDREDADTLQIYLKATNGTGEIRMDWIPVRVEFYDPTEFTSIYQDILCGNLSSGVFPDLYQAIDTDENTSVFIERNITLPTPYMSVSFKVRKCVEPELKYYSCLLLPDACYTHEQECNYDPKGTITFYLKDAVTGDFLTDIKSEVIYGNRWEFREYAIDSLQPNEIYTVGLAVVPENTVDPNYYCVYVDDLNIDIREIPLVCASECLPDRTYIKRVCKSYDPDGFCEICEEIEIENAIECIADEGVKQKISECSDYCGCEEFDEGHDKYNTLYQGSFLENCNVTLVGIDACCLYTEISDSPYCVEYCETQLIGDVPDETTQVLNELGVPEFYHPLASPLAIIFYIMLGAMVLIFVTTKSWQISSISGFVLFMVLGFLFVELLYMVIIIIVVAGVIFGKLMLFDRSGG